MKYLFFVLLFSFITNAQKVEREFRGAWVATVANLDWPSSPNLSVEEQKAEMITMLDKLQNQNFNAVVFQVRPECDALYKSNYEPWSYWLTGEQGKAPEPFYDPLEFAIEESHKRGIELHAWLNPYRAERAENYFPLAENHVVKKHPNYVLNFPKKKILNPGLPEVRKFVTNVVVDIVRRYNVDGIHFDDYFYPYPQPEIGFNGVTTEDSETFKQHNRGYNDVHEWRRSNIDLLIEMVHDSIKTYKPFVRFGVSPFGIWKDGIPHGVKGFSAFDKIYCDPIKWISDKTVDYISPQLYWQILGDQSFDKLYNWWISVNDGIDIFPGIASYRLLDKNWEVEEIDNQLNIIDSVKSDSKGYIFFRAEDFTNNVKGISDLIKTKHQINFAVTSPFIDSNEIVIPPKISEIKILEENISFEVEDHKPNQFYLIYTFSNKNKVDKLIKIVSSREITIERELTKDNRYIAIVRISELKNLSRYSRLIMM